MEALPLLIAAAAAVALAGPMLRALPERQNYAGRQTSFPGGALLIAAVVMALVPLGLLDQITEGDELWPSHPSGIGIGGIAVFILGAAALGLMDDTLGGAEDRGLRGHARALREGRISTGAIKAIGILGLAAFTLSGLYENDAEYLLAVALLTLTTNLFNQLDLRPGRSLKVFVLLGLGLTIADADSLWLLGLFAAPLIVLLPLDLREHTMLGDTGANAAGATAGLWLVIALGTTGQAIALAAVAIITLYGEFRSITELVDRMPPLRWLDSLGRLKGRSNA